MNKGQRILEIEQDSVKKYISDRQKRLVNLPPRPTKIVAEDDENHKKLTVKQRLRTEIAYRPSFHQNEPEMEQFSWQKKLTNIEKKNLLDNLVKNYHKFKKITDRSVENNRNFMPIIKRPAFSAKYEKIVKKNQHHVSLSKERVKTCAVYEKGEVRIRNIFEGNYEAEIFNKENKKIVINEKEAEKNIINEKIVNIIKKLIDCKIILGDQQDGTFEAVGVPKKKNTQTN